MRFPLVELDPRWLSEGAGRSQMGIEFECPEHTNCRVQVWFEDPLDGGLAITVTDRRPLYCREGADFPGLTVYPPVEHGDALIMVYEGWVNVA
jgi:hypothetical protein